MVGTSTLVSIFAVKLLQALIDRFGGMDHKQARNNIQQILCLKGDEDEIKYNFNFSNCKNEGLSNRAEQDSDFVIIALRLELLLVLKQMFVFNDALPFGDRVRKEWSELHGSANLSKLGALTDGDTLHPDLLNSLQFGNSSGGAHFDFVLPRSLENANLRGSDVMNVEADDDIEPPSASGNEDDVTEQPPVNDNDEEESVGRNTGSLRHIMLGKDVRGGKGVRGGKQLVPRESPETRTNDGGGGVKRIGGAMPNQEGTKSKKRAKTVNVNAAGLLAILETLKPVDERFAPTKLEPILSILGLEDGNEGALLDDIVNEFKTKSLMKLKNLLKKLDPTLCLEKEAEEEDDVEEEEEEESEDEESEDEESESKELATGVDNAVAQDEGNYQGGSDSVHASSNGVGVKTSRQQDDSNQVYEESESESESESNESTSGEDDAVAQAEGNYQGWSDSVHASFNGVGAKASRRQDDSNQEYDVSSFVQAQAFVQAQEVDEDYVKLCQTIVDFEDDDNFFGFHKLKR